jgi:Ca2+-binding EF-hand superfamily protein
MKNILLIAAICAATTANVQAFEGPGAGITGEENAKLALLDTDGDGIVTREEMEAARLAEFETGDSDGNGYLSAEELEAMKAARHAERLTTLFDLIDADDDLVISLEEMTSASPGADEERIAVEFEVFAGSDGVMDEVEFAYMHSPEARAVRNFIAMDSDGDGLISSEEFGTPPAGNRSGNGRPPQDGEGQGPRGEEGQRPRR